MSGEITGLTYPGQHYQDEPGLYGDNSEPPPVGDPANIPNGGFTEEQVKAYERSMTPTGAPRPMGLTGPGEHRDSAHVREAHH